MDSIQEKALKMALNGHNLLITGYPGTGKSFTVARIAEQLQKQATKTGRHDIAEILLKVALNTKKNQSIFESI